MGGGYGPHDWVDDDFIDRDSIPIPSPQLDPWNPARFQGDLTQNSMDEQATGASETEGAAGTSWDIEDLRGEAILGPWSDIPVEKEDWAVPDPTADPVSALNESLYPPDNSITDISRELKIGEMLSLVAPCTRMQHTRCHELLSTCGVGRLRLLIPWLRKRAWCGDKLQLFLEFRNLWETPEKAHWWEIFFWDHYIQAWIPKYDCSTLTLEQAHELVDKRAGCVVSDVIDRSWFDDWEDSVVWEHGIRSFASFAILRARSPDGDQWREYLDRHDQRTALEIDQCTDPSFAPFMLPSIVRQYSCPRAVDILTDPWPDVTDMAHRRAAALGGDMAQAWEEVIDGITGL